MSKGVKRKFLEVHCDCAGAPEAAQRVVRKDSPNRGREFWTCANNPQCKFFQWADGQPSRCPKRCKLDTQQPSNNVIAAEAPHGILVRIVGDRFQACIAASLHWKAVTKAAGHWNDGLGKDSQGRDIATLLGALGEEAVGTCLALPRQLDVVDRPDRLGDFCLSGGRRLENKLCSGALVIKAQEEVDGKMQWMGGAQKRGLFAEWYAFCRLRHFRGVTVKRLTKDDSFDDEACQEAVVEVLGCIPRDIILQEHNTLHRKIKKPVPHKSNQNWMNYEIPLGTLLPLSAVPL